MSLSDCGCSGLVTPTIDELLAVARQKPLPRVRIRERRPPPAKVGATLKGWMEWRLVNRQGREVRGGEGPNLILNQGLDQIATLNIRTHPTVGNTNFPLMQYAAVGTSSSAPTASDTGLGSELARVNTTYAMETITRPSPGVYRMTRFIEFGYAVGNGVLAEWGFSSAGASGANLFNRALFTDSNGDPDAVTKTDQEKLRLAYTLEVSLSPTTWTAGAFTVANVGVVNGDYTLLGGSDVKVPDHSEGSVDLWTFQALAQGYLRDHGGLRAADVDLSGSAYGIPVEHNTLSGALQYADNVNYIARDPYVPGSFTRTGGAWFFDTSQGNTAEIRAFAIRGRQQFTNTVAHGYVFAVDVGDQFGKDDEHTLTIGAPTVTWGRAS